MPVAQNLSRVTISQIQELTGRDRRSIKRDLTEKKLEPVHVDGRAYYYNSKQALAALYGRDMNAGEELMLLNRAKRELAELDLAVKRGELIPEVDVETTLVAITSPIALRLDAIPVKVAPEARAATTDVEAEAIIRKHIDQVRTELADLSARYTDAGASGSQGSGSRGSGGASSTS